MIASSPLLKIHLGGTEVVFCGFGAVSVGVYSEVAIEIGLGIFEAIEMIQGSSRHERRNIRGPRSLLELAFQSVGHPVGLFIFSLNKQNIDKHNRHGRTQLMVRKFPEKLHPIGGGVLPLGEFYRTHCHVVEDYRLIGMIREALHQIQIGLFCLVEVPPWHSARNPSPSGSGQAARPAF